MQWRCCFLLRVLVFGDSVVNGGSQTDHRQLATSLMEAHLRDSLHRTVVVGNVSAGSWGPGNWLAYIRRFGTFDADWVLLVVNSGDYADNPTFEPLNPSTHPMARPLFALQEAISRYLPRYIPNLSPPPPAEPKLPPDADVAKGLGDLRAFLVAAASRGARVLVLHHPDLTEVSAGRTQVGESRMRVLCAELGIPFIEMIAPYRAAGGVALYRDGIHPNARGQEVMAGEMERSVRCGLKPDQPC